MTLEPRISCTNNAGDIFLRSATHLPKSLSAVCNHEIIVDNGERALFIAKKLSHLFLTTKRNSLSSPPLPIWYVLLPNTDKKKEHHANWNNDR